MRAVSAQVKTSALLLLIDCLGFNRTFNANKLQGSPKNWHIFVRVITSSNTDQFSNFSLSESGENF